MLLSVLGAVPDPRSRRWVRHPLVDLLAIGQWAAAHPAALPDGKVAARRVPDESTFRRVFARVDAGALAATIGAWLWTRTQVRDGRRVIALDGKTSAMREVVKLSV